MSVTPTPPPPPAARVREVLDLALERPAHERAAFIAGVCREDDWLRREVESLLGALDAGGDLLEPPAAPAPTAAQPLTGLSFGNYKVGERVGEGGMGIVYRAEDTRLGRAVAVKALPATLARDSHRRARFENEARVLASLSHPNIAAIHGVEETARGPVLVLEFVPGETLARRLDRGRLPVEEAINIGAQIARGLEAAHAAGVVHRDLKPSNIQLTPEGSVKILDFGVAKQAQPRESIEPGHTMTGQLIRTAGYMSPEQARGRAVDRRTDLWALGCVLYEMLTGARAFDGETSSDTVAAVLRAEPDWSRVPANAPAAAVRVLHRCLQKDPDLRQRDAGDVVLELTSEETPPMRPARGRRWGVAVIAVGALVLGVTLGVLFIGDRSARPESKAAPVKFQVTLPRELGLSVSIGGAMAISPDGRTLVFAAGPVDRERLCARRMDSTEIVELAGTEGARDPCFSPDGKWIAFRVENELRRIPADGGGSEVLVPNGVAHTGVAWDESGILCFGGRPWGLQRLRPDGSTTMLTPVDRAKESGLAHPEPLPGGDVVVFTSTRVRGDTFEPCVEALRVSTGERRMIATDAAGARFCPPNRLVYWQGGALVTAPLDLQTLKLTDAAIAVLRPLAGGEIGAYRRFALSRAGVLATLPENIQYDLTRLAWYGPDGTWAPVTEWSAGSIDSPRLSPDGSRIAVLVGRGGGDVWVYDLDRGTKNVITEGDNHHHIVWSPDGRSIVFTTQSPDETLRFQRALADGSGAPETLWEVPNGVWLHATDFLPDGRLLLTIDDGSADPIDLWVFDAEKREAPRRLMQTRAHRYGARVSPDGTMIAYTSEETGMPQVYMQRYPSLEQKVTVSAGRGYRPVWSRDSTKLFFRYVDRAMVVDVGRGPGGEIVLSAPRLVAEHMPDARYEVDSTGTRLLMGRPAGELGPQTKIDVVVGWDPGAR